MTPTRGQFRELPELTLFPGRKAVLALTLKRCTRAGGELPRCRNGQRPGPATSESCPIPRRAARAGLGGAQPLGRADPRGGEPSR